MSVHVLVLMTELHCYMKACSDVYALYFVLQQKFNLNVIVSTYALSLISIKIKILII